MKYAFASVALSVPAALLAQVKPVPSPLPTPVTNGVVAIKSETFIARQITDEKGRKVNKLYVAQRVVPGDVLVVKFGYNNSGSAPATKFAVNTKVSDAVKVTDIREKWAIVSVDGGKVFGPLATLKVKGSDGKLRAATSDDVTNIRWTLAQPVPAGGSGDVMYFGVVR